MWLCMQHLIGSAEAVVEFRVAPPNFLNKGHEETVRTYSEALNFFNDS